MGAAIDFLRERGLTAKAQGKRIIVSPASKLTDDVRKYVKAHRLELLAELAANDGIERRAHWRVCLLIAVPSSWLASPALMPKRWRTRRDMA